jgi:FtsZ-binding cell division protein ZapB
LSLDSLSQLETKIDMLISTITSLREEKMKLSEEAELSSQKIREFESGNKAIVEELESLKNSNEEKQKKLDSAAEKVQGLLAKLESVA